MKESEGRYRISSGVRRKMEGRGKRKGRRTGEYTGEEGGGGGSSYESYVGELEACDRLRSKTKVPTIQGKSSTKKVSISFNT